MGGSFFETLKRELIYHRHNATRQETRQEIFECIGVFYDRQRLHQEPGYRRPEEFEQHERGA